jgi:hypothetical protein
VHCAVNLYLLAFTSNGTWNNLKPVSCCDFDFAAAIIKPEDYYVMNSR